MPSISILVAHSNNRVIGRDGQMPWRLSRDLKNFKRLTWGHAIIMGRKTMDSIGRLLPGRMTIVLTRQAAFQVPGAQVAGSWPAAVATAATLAPDKQEIFVVGGAEVYRLAMPSCDRIYLTEVHTEIDGDTYFPEIDPHQWIEAHRVEYPADDQHDFPHALVVLDRSQR